MNPNINESNKDNKIAGSLKILVTPKDDGLYVCRLSRFPHLIGNTVVENAQVTVISIDPTLQIAQAERWIDDDD
jgi:hypothetical protein